MDRVISLLAALVGLIALGGAILVHTNADAQRTQMAAEIAQLKLSVGLLGQQQSPVKTADAQSPEPILSLEPPSSSEPASSSATPVVALAPPAEPPSSAAAEASSTPASSGPPATDAVDVDVKALQDRLAALEQQTKQQASELQEAQAKLASMSSAPPAATQVATADSIVPNEAAQSPNPAAIDPAGPTKDCIPLGTRFMGQSGDSFPICKTKVIVKVAGVSDGLATIAGPGDVAVGGIGALSQGCQVSVVSADTTGFAEMRVTCQ
jgi:hypothetical protein